MRRIPGGKDSRCLLVIPGVVSERRALIYTPGRALSAEFADS